MTIAEHYYEPVLLTIVSLQEVAAPAPFFSYGLELFERIQHSNNQHSHTTTGYIAIGITTLTLEELKQLFPDTRHAILFDNQLLKPLSKATR